MTDTERLDWLENYLSGGCLETCFEMDGGIHATFSRVGDPAETVLRERNDFRSCIDEMVKLEKGL